jgi:hypothetical protein
MSYISIATSVQKEQELFDKRKVERPDWPIQKLRNQLDSQDKVEESRRLFFHL